LKRFDVAALTGVIERYRGTAMFLVPTMLVRLLEQLDDESRLRSLRTVVYGGASMPVDRLLKGLERLGPVFVQIYGLTESTWPVCALSREDHLRRPEEDDASWRARLSSCGRPTAVGRVRIVRRDGGDAGVGELGEILVRGRNTMSGYWRAGTHADAKGLDADGWMHTGDVGRCDADGFVTIVDRLHDMIVSGGFNVYPREVEDALSSHPAVLESAVVGLPSEEWGETVHACVVLKPGASATAEDLIAHCGRHLAGYKKPRSLDLVDALPRNPSGKILRRALRSKRRRPGASGRASSS
jgi:acyl-CoA synthetase (AMP-forming)/AMP-acid ligase II